jgi:hypothetical protein
LGTRSFPSFRWLVASLALAMAPSMGCGADSEVTPGAGAHPEGGVPAPGADATTGADAGDALSDASSDAVVDAPAPAWICTSDDDCLAVLDYRDGFECWGPTAASTAAVSADPCLIPWKPNARCTTPPPPPGCHSGPIPVQHSCFVMPCAIPSCNEGTCMVRVGFRNECPVVDAGPPDCAALQATYVQAATAAQQCDPTQDAAVCIGEYPDTCGCGAAFNFSGRAGTALDCAFQAIRDAQCSFPTCGTGTRCPTVPDTGATTCAANESGASGTCAWAN